MVGAPLKFIFILAHDWTEGEIKLPRSEDGNKLPRSKGGIKLPH